MSFRRRNVGLSAENTGTSSNPLQKTPKNSITGLPGIRASPLDGRATTSTGTPALDSLLGGHAGLPLGTSILIEESGTTDYAGVLLRYYAAEGLMQGHQVHVVGLPEQWGRELPGLVRNPEKGPMSARPEDKMKIAWRYEGLGQFGGGANARGGFVYSLHSIALASWQKHLQAYTLRFIFLIHYIELVSEHSLSQNNIAPAPDQKVFCHIFDLTKRLVHPPNSSVAFLRIGTTSPGGSPFAPILERLSVALAKSASDTAHRVVVPALLSPALYPPEGSNPHHVLHFLRSLRALLYAHQGRLTAMMTLPSSLYPRTSGLVRWMELLSDGVIELSPFPHTSAMDAGSSHSSTDATILQEEQPQGLLRVHRVPLLHEHGGEASAMGGDWTFNLSRKRFNIKPSSLPPVEVDTKAQQEAGAEQKGKKADLEF